MRDPYFKSRNIKKLSLPSLEHQCSADVEVYYVGLKFISNLLIGLHQIKQTMLKAEIELPLIPHLHTEFVVQPEIETLQT